MGARVSLRIPEVIQEDQAFGHSYDFRLLTVAALSVTCLFHIESGKRPLDISADTIPRVSAAELWRIDGRDMSRDQIIEVPGEATGGPVEKRRA